MSATASSAPAPAPLPWLEPFLPVGLRVADGVGASRTRRQARVVVAEALLALAGMMGVALALTFGGYSPMLSVLALATGALPLAALYLVRQGSSLHLAAALVAASILTTAVTQAFFDGGVRDPALMLVVVGPLGAAMASGRRLALLTLALAVAGVGWLLMLELGGHVFPHVASADDVKGWTFLLLACVSTLSMMAGVLYTRHSEAALAAAEAEAERLGDSLQASEARYEALVDRIPVGIYRATPRGQFLLVNPSLATIFGASSAEALIGQSIGSFYTDANAGRDFRALVDRDGTARGFSTFIRRADGVRRRLRIDGHAVRDADGTARYYEGTVEDITDAEVVRQAVERSEARFRALVQRSSDVTLVLDAAARVTYASPAVERLLGYAPSDLLGQYALDWVHPEDRRAAALGFARARRHVLPPSEVRLGHLLGHVVHVDATAASFFDDSAVGGLVVNVRDATERQRALAVLTQAKRQAEEVARLKSTFLANMSHEIRTPLTAILGFADVLAEEVTDPEHQEFVGMIAQGGRRLMDTLNSVLDLARLEAGRGELALVPHRVADGVTEVVRLMQPQAGARGLALSAIVEAPDVMASLDDPAFARVLHNLVGNALKFTPEGGAVAVTVAADTTHVFVAVRDTGIGIPPDFLPRLFGEFEQAALPTGRANEGAGLGLSIARQLVERMGGTIVVDSTVGEGTTFTIVLDRVDADATPDARPTILVVDDNEQARHVARRMLDGPYHVVTAGSADEALAVAARTPPHIAVLDIHLGAGADGTEVMRRLRDLPGLAGLPVVAVTAYGLPGDRARYRALGFHEYLPKPFSRDALLRAVRDVMSPRAYA